VDILFQGRKLEKVCTDQRRCIKKFGFTCGTLIERRLKELKGAVNLEAMCFERQAKCHELTGDRKGTLAVALEQPYRLIFEPVHDLVPRKPDGGLDWTQVTAIRVLAVEDYHD
jgi:plasmid maintenance system killer protein